MVCGQGRNRTADTRIFSPLLYRLSYLARAFEYCVKPMESQGFHGFPQRPLKRRSVGERAFGCGRWAVLAPLGISDCRSHISDLRFEICHLKSQRACPQPHSRSPRSLPAAPFMFLGAHSAHFSRERGLSRSQGDVRYWSYLRALNPTSKTFGAEKQRSIGSR